MSKLPGIILIILSVIVGGYFWRQSDMVESAMLIRQGTNKMTVLQGTKKITANSSQNSFLASGLVGMWSFNGQDVTDKIYDRSGQNNNGYFGISTATTSAKIMGKVGQALSFDGVDDYIRLPTYSISNLVNGSSAVSLSAWIKPNSFGGAGARRRSVGFMLSTSQTGGLLGTIGSTLEIGGRSTTTDAFQAATSTSLLASANKWIFAAGILDFANDRIIVYINGEQNAIKTVAFNSNAYEKGAAATEIDAIGSYTGSSEFFNGVIDEVRVYNRALSADEVMSLWQAGR